MHFLPEPLDHPCRSVLARSEHDSTKTGEGLFEARWLRPGSCCRVVSLKLAVSLSHCLMLQHLKFACTLDFYSAPLGFFASLQKDNLLASVYWLTAISRVNWGWLQEWVAAFGISRAINVACVENFYYCRPNGDFWASLRTLLKTNRTRSKDDSLAVAWANVASYNRRQGCV